MSPVVHKSLNIATHIFRPKLLYLHLLHQTFLFQNVEKFGPTVCGPMDHRAGAFGPAERRYARKLVIISQFQTSMVIQTKQ